MKKYKNIICFIIVLILFVFVASFDTIETSNTNTINTSKITRELNINSK